MADERLDTIICLNVLEHIAADEEVLGHFYRLLAAGRPRDHPGAPASLALLARPTRPSATSGATPRRELRDKLDRAGFEVVHQQGFNRLGTLGWYVSGKLLGKEHLSPGQMKMFNRILPLAKLIERFPAGRPSRPLPSAGSRFEGSSQGRLGQDRAGPPSRANAGACGAVSAPAARLRCGG